MRTLVTGHDGYLGSVMVPFLQRAGHHVVGLDTRLFRETRFGAASAAANGNGRPAREVERDLRDVEPGDLAGLDAVIHLAALSNDPLGDLDPELTADINRDASIRLARLAKEEGVSRFLFASSCSLYGVAGEEPVDESSAFNPITPYGHSKVAVEEALRDMADDHFSPTFLRNATAYGASPALRLDVVVNNLVASGFTTGEVVLKSDGTSWRPLAHVEDIARAFRAVLEAPRDRIHARAFNVGRQGEDYRISELAETVARALPGTRVRIEGGATSDPRSYRVDCSRLPETLPAYRPRWTVKRGIRELVDAFRKEELSRADLESGRYIRLREIRRLLEAGRLSPDLRWTNGNSRSHHEGGGP